MYGDTWTKEQKEISIHAPTRGATRRKYSGRKPIEYFNPRPPHGERRFIIAQLLGKKAFQSTPPTRGATATVNPVVI